MKRVVYRTCRRCRRDWNVSRIEPGDKVYICPKCERRKKCEIETFSTQTSPRQS